MTNVTGLLANPFSLFHKDREQAKKNNWQNKKKRQTKVVRQRRKRNQVAKQSRRRNR